MRRWRIVAAVLAVLVLSASTLAVVAGAARRRIAEQLATANAEVLARESGARLGRDPVLAAELALAGWRSDPDNPAARSALADAYVATAARRLGRPAGAGRPLAARRLRHRRRRPHPVGGRVHAHHRPPRPEPELLAATGVPDLRETRGTAKGRQVAVIAADGRLRLWDVGGGAVTLAEPTASPRSLASSPDRTRLGWLESGGVTGTLLRVLDTAAGTTATAALPAGTTHVQFTGDPDRVVVTTGAGRTVRSIASGADVRTLDADTTVIPGGGEFEIRCLEPSPRVLIVHDTASGAELHRVPLTGYDGCSSLRFTGPYAVQANSVGYASPAQMYQVVDLARGRSYQLKTPDLDDFDWEDGVIPVVALVPTGEDVLTALVAIGPTLLRIPAVPDAPPHEDAVAVNGGMLLRSSTAPDSSRFSVHDPTDWRLLAEVTVVLTVGGWYVDYVDYVELHTVGMDEAGAVFDIRSLPDLRHVARFRAPGTIRDGDGLMVGRDERTRTVTMYVDGVLTAWDMDTGAQIGPPLPLPINRQAAYLLQVEGWRAHVLLIRPEGLALWDVATGRQITSSDVRTLPSILVRGDTVVLHTIDDNIKVRSLPDLTLLGEPIPAPEIAALEGFDAEGRLVATTGTDMGQIVFWNLEQRREVGRMRPLIGAVASLDGTTVTVAGRPGVLPEVLAAGAGDWQAHLCRLAPPSPSAAVTGLLPPGVEASSPCS